MEKQHLEGKDGKKRHRFPHRSKKSVSPSNLENPTSNHKTMLDEKNDLDGLGLSDEECAFLQISWERAMTTVDVGGELIIRLLNDKRSLFRQLLESHYEIPDTSLFTLEIINNDCPRAKQVGEGVVRFISKLFERLACSASVAEIREMCMDLGARHYKRRVWFQAENWLCVKNSLLEVILILGNKPSSGGLISMCVGGQPQSKFFGDSNAQRAAWTKMIQFIIRNMKRGFLGEALKNDHIPETKADSS